MARIDLDAIEGLGIPEVALMENAAARTADAARRMVDSVENARVLLLCGRGNNAGDALAAGRHLLGWGADIRAFIAGPRDSLKALARIHADVLERLGVPLFGSIDALDLRVNLVIDGLLGYSARGPARGGIAAAIATVNAVSVPILAVDIPSGLDPDTGDRANAAIRAAVTVTFGLPKAGLLSPKARPAVGELVLADIGIPRHALRRYLGPDSLPFARGPLVRLALA